MTSLLKSEATFKERARESGLTDDEVKSLLDQGLNSLSASVAVRAVSSMRQLMFEAQALCVTTLKNSPEGESDKKTDLAPAKRQARINDQKKRLAGLELTGPYENAFLQLCLCRRCARSGLLKLPGAAPIPHQSL